MPSIPSRREDDYNILLTEKGLVAFLCTNCEFQQIIRRRGIVLRQLYPVGVLA